MINSITERYHIMDHGDHKLFLYNDMIDLVITTNSVTTDNRPMNNRKLTAHKGLTNTITFNIRNRDRKLQSVFTDELVAYLVNPQTKRRMLTKRLENSSSVGITKLYLTEGDLQNITAGLYKMYIVKNEATNDAISVPLYTNQNNAVNFDIEITDDAFVEPVPTQETSTFLQVEKNSTGIANIFSTSALLGNVERNYLFAHHSVAIYPDAYTGNVKIQGSCIESSPDLDDASADWFTLETVALTNESNIVYRNFTVNANWIRVLSLPDDANSSITKVMLRN